MNIIEEQFLEWSQSTLFEDAIKILPKRLKKNHQMEMYNRIYNQYFFSLTDNVGYEFKIVKNLNDAIQFLVFSQIYKHYIVLGLERIDYSDKEEIILSILSDEYFIDSFINTAFYILDDFEGKIIEFYVEQYPQNRLCFPYILAHKAGLLSFDSMADMLIMDENFSKIPIVFKLEYEETGGPHDGKFNEKTEFFYHDYEHFSYVQNNIKIYNLKKTRQFMRSLNKNSFEFKFMNLFVQVEMFESFSDGPYDHLRNNEELLHRIDNFLEDLIRYLDTFDIGYAYSYLRKYIDIEIDQNEQEILDNIKVLISNESKLRKYEDKITKTINMEQIFEETQIPISRISVNGLKYQIITLTRSNYRLLFNTIMYSNFLEIKNINHQIL